MTDLYHTSIADVRIFLTHGAVTRRLVEQRETCATPYVLNNFVGTYHLLDGAAGTIEAWAEANSGVNIPPGDYLPEETFAGFAGADAAGTWTLLLQDRDINDVGTLGGWTLRLIP
jgi:hypothetical protein